MRLWIVLFILFTSTLHAQYKDGIVVIQYTADFVKAAEVNLDKLEGAVLAIYRCIGFGAAGWSSRPRPCSSGATPAGVHCRPTSLASSAQPCRRGSRAPRAREDVVARGRLGECSGLARRAPSAK